MKVVVSIEDEEGARCVDVFVRRDGTFGFKEFRRDPEDGGRWFLVADYSGKSYGSKDEALRAAASTITWFTWEE